MESIARHETVNLLEKGREDMLRSSAILLFSIFTLRFTNLCQSLLCDFFLSIFTLQLIAFIQSILCVFCSVFSQSILRHLLFQLIFTLRFVVFNRPLIYALDIILFSLYVAFQCFKSVFALFFKTDFCQYLISASLFFFISL